MKFLPIFVTLEHRHCVVVGGGDIAARKTELLLRCNARVTVIAPEIGARVSTLLDQGLVTVLRRPFGGDDLDDAILVIAATDIPAVNKAVSEAAHRLKLPVNVVDQPELCSFIMPAIVDRSPIVAAVSSGGAAPVLARLIRGRIESLIPASLGRLAALAETFRARVKTTISDLNRRRDFWERVFQGPIAEMVYAGREDAASQALTDALADSGGGTGARGEVYLVGGGPGDPDLLTFRALRLMQQADVVVYDRLVSPGVLDLVRRDAERIYVGKARSEHTMRQEDINLLLARLAHEGKRVLRLKGGDPFIFGRGGEEIQTLAAEGVPFQVVPGITAATGGAAYAGIPLTHRDYAQSCIFVTGHLKDGSINLDWPHLAKPHQTLVFYMGLNGLPEICRQLIGNGLAPDTPAALVQQATTPRQRVFGGTLNSMPDIVVREKPQPPTLLIVGEVVRMREKLGWFEPSASGAWPLPDDPPRIQDPKSTHA